MWLGYEKTSVFEYGRANDDLKDTGRIDFNLNEEATQNILHLIHFQQLRWHQKLNRQNKITVLIRHGASFVFVLYPPPPIRCLPITDIAVVGDHGTIYK